MAEQRHSPAYAAGVQLTIEKHQPLPPFGRDHKNAESVRKPVHGLKEEPLVDHTSFALSHPPVETESATPPGETKSHVLTIIGDVSRRRRGKQGGPRLLRCYMDSDVSVHYVAKLYDGLHYPVYDWRGLDCMYLAEMDYSREAAAYEAIPSALQGAAVPRYFGSWTASIECRPSPPTSCRRVRMILMEFIDGESLLDTILGAGAYLESDGKIDLSEVDYQILPPVPERLDVLAAVIEAYVALFHAGVVHKFETSLEDVVVLRSQPGRVVIIDFHRALVLKRYEWGRDFLRREGRCPKPMSPVERWWGGLVTSTFGGWVPQSWFKAKDMEKEWLCSRWLSSRRYMPLSGEFLIDNCNDPLVVESCGEAEGEQDIVMEIK